MDAAPTPPPADLAATALLKALRRVRDNLDARAAGLRDGSDADYGHQVRVGLRRARAVLALDTPALGFKLRRVLREDMSWLGRPIGAVRDLVLAQAHLGGAALEGAKAQALAQVAASLDDPRAQLFRTRLDLAISACEADRSGALLCPSAAKTARKRLRQLLRDGGKLGAMAEPEALHQLRKDGKKLRYALESSADLSARGWCRLVIAELRTLQDWLGDYQDLSTRIDLLALAGDEPTRRAALLERASRTQQFPPRFAAFATAMAELQAVQALAGAQR
jgi:CHAD domain-containing protein